MCHRSNESIVHLLKECEIAQKFWQDLQVPSCLRDSFKLLVGEWLELNCKTGMSPKFLGIPWKLLFPMGVWQLWLHWDNYVFQTSKVDNLILKRCIQVNA